MCSGIAQPLFFRQSELPGGLLSANLPIHLAQFDFEGRCRVKELEATMDVVEEKALGGGTRLVEYDEKVYNL